jgi:hypothetical protein
MTPGPNYENLNRALDGARAWAERAILIVPMPDHGDVPERLDAVRNARAWLDEAERMIGRSPP